MEMIFLSLNGIEYICSTFFDTDKNGGIGGIEVYEVVEQEDEDNILLGSIDNFELPDKNDPEDLEQFKMKIGVWINENGF